MKGSCERCGCTLEPAGKALICSHECTFCCSCGDHMGHECPNCGGELVLRPRRTDEGVASG
ncbi:MAG: DUF1272 domain-containing protein [Gammaproteobacteria bacterium]|nr:DUF1272 domain-containing protein [Gammaproteobacteria bacterium]NNM21087.1 DUF1272 domain-containing protein [Gammaproteobacteria bacterium]